MKNTDQIKNEIEKAAKEGNCTEIEIISQMQGLLNQKKYEKGILQLHTLKMEYINKLGIF